MDHGFARHYPDPLRIDTFTAFLPSTVRERERNRMAGNGVTECGEGKNCWGMAPRECDSCKHSPALLFCRADSAFLCGACDSKVHGANKLASRHERVLVCEVCEQAPAAVTCKADAAMLCISCDADIHSANPLARRHERFAVVPFYDSPSAALKPTNGSDLIKASDDREDEGVVNETEPLWVPPDSEPYLEKSSAEVPVLKTAEYFSDVDPYLEFDYGSSEPRYEHTDSVVPVRTKTPLPALVAADLDFCRTKPSYGGYSISSSDAGVVPDAGAMNEVTYPYGRANGLPSSGEPDREARLMRYREKKKSRKFEKTIRYASRKAYAERRPRIKGRFAKRTQNSGQTIYSSAADISTDGEYGVVPSF